MNKLSFENVNILVIGDIMLDIYKHGKASRISPEAPVPVVLVSDENIAVGGAANVAVNLRGLGCPVELIGYIGNDYIGQQLKAELLRYTVKHDNIIQSTVATISKTRVLANKQHMIRYDDDSEMNTLQHRQCYEPILIESLIRLSEQQSFDIVIVSDYAKGTITKRVMETIRLCFQCPVVCDFKPVNSSLFHDVFCVTPNLNEAKQLAATLEYKSLCELTTIIKQSLGVEVVVITLAEDGICLLDQNDEYHAFSARVVVDKKNNPTWRPDVTGAGDTVVSTLAACLATKHSLSESVRLSNLASGVVVGKTGTAVCFVEELQRENLRM